MIDWQDRGDHGHRRRFARRPVAMRTQLNVQGKQVHAVTENISPGGAFLRVALPSAVRHVLASFELPDGRTLPVRARVRWRREMPAGIGIEFETFLPEAPPPAR
ncbi:MAG TPA: PilZ domain-containing protein [Myxococcales bacterium]|nr:PilZ domain-containing protein [Myxococcales bacterium]